MLNRRDGRGACPHSEATSTAEGCHLLTHPLTYALARSLTYSLTHSPTHSLRCLPHSEATNTAEGWCSATGLASRRYTCTCIRMCICICILTCICLASRRYTWMYMYMSRRYVYSLAHVVESTWRAPCMKMYICICRCIYRSIYMCIHICIYRYTWSSRSGAHLA